MLPKTLLAALALVPALAHAAMFPKDSKVKQIDAKTFKKVMQEDVRNPALTPCLPC
jgi:protein disulfide-isomerase A6